MDWFDAARSRAGAMRDRAGEWLKVAKLPDWWRRSDKSAERRAVATRATSFLADLYLVFALSAWVLEFGFATLWAIRANGDLDWTWQVGTQGELGGPWAFQFSAHLIPAVLTTAAVAVIVGVSVSWIPAYNGLKGFGRLRRGAMGVVGPLCTVIAISGAIVVQAENMALSARDTDNVRQAAGQTRESLDRQITGIDAQLAAMRDRRQTNEYAALAATVGAAQYRELYICPACLAREPDAARRQLLQRAVGAAVAADDLEAKKARLNAQLEHAPTEASLRSVTHAVQSNDVQSTVDWISDHRVLLLGATLSLVGLFGLWWRQGLREAHELLDPAAPEREADVRPEAPTPATPPIDELDLPGLADWRAEPDPEFAMRSVTVDEQGRRMKRVGAHWRVDDDSAPKASPRDVRRAEAPAPAEPEAPRETEDEDLGGLMSRLGLKENAQ